MTLTARINLHYKFITDNYVQFGTITRPCLSEAVWTGLQKKWNSILCLEESYTEVKVLQTVLQT